MYRLRSRDGGLDLTRQSSAFAECGMWNVKLSVSRSYERIFGVKGVRIWRIVIEWAKLMSLSLCVYRSYWFFAAWKDGKNLSRFFLCRDEMDMRVWKFEWKRVVGCWFDFLHFLQNSWKRMLLIVMICILIDVLVTEEIWILDFWKRGLNSRYTQQRGLWYCAIKGRLTIDWNRDCKEGPAQNGIRSNENITEHGSCFFLFGNEVQERSGLVPYDDMSASAMSLIVLSDWRRFRLFFVRL